MPKFNENMIYFFTASSLHVIKKYVSCQCPSIGEYMHCMIKGNLAYKAARRRPFHKNQMKATRPASP
jgi:hypothetical protein